MTQTTDEMAEQMRDAIAGRQRLGLTVAEDIRDTAVLDDRDAKAADSACETAKERRDAHYQASALLDKAAKALGPVSEAGRSLGPQWNRHETHWNDRAFPPVSVGDIRQCAAVLAEIEAYRSLQPAPPTER